MKYKFLIYSFSVVAITLCGANIFFAIKYEGLYTNLFTSISGWVSGLSTVVLGIIAIWQNYSYKNINEKNIILSELNNEREIVDNLYNDFIFNCDSSLIVRILLPLKKNITIQDVYEKCEQYIITLSKKEGIIINKVSTFGYYYDKDSSLGNKFNSYYNLVNNISEKLLQGKIIRKNDIDNIMTEFQDILIEFKKYMVKHMHFIKKCKSLPLRKIKELLSEMDFNKQKRIRDYIK